MAETTIADAWIYATLAASSELQALIGTPQRIYRGMKPEAAKFPCVVFFYQPGGQDVRGVGTINIMVSGYWVVKAIDRNNSPVQAARIADLVYALLHGSSGVVGDEGSVLSMVRDEPIAFVEYLDNALYQHIGGVYRVYVQRSED
ncbi:MAG: hypothetical protein ABFE02_00245 [Sulfuricella sp.]